MVTKKPRIVIIGAGMAGLTAANKLYTSPNSTQLFELLVVEGGSRIGGRINSSEFCGDRIEQGATWIHGIGGSPVYKIAQETNSLQSQQPWECMDEIYEDPVTIAEGGYELSPSLVEPISTLFKNLMDFCQGKSIDENGVSPDEILKLCTKNGSVGSFLRQGLKAYWDMNKDQNGIERVGNWSRKSLEEAIFAIHESIQRTYTGADDLCTLDYNAESDYIMFPGEEITIAKGYLSVIESLASVLPVGMIQLGRKVEKIEWQPQELQIENGHESISKPVKLHFSDGSILLADHVIVTVSLGVLKHGIRQDSGMFNPPLPNSKINAISRLGYGVVNKVFLQTTPSHNQEPTKFPFLQMAFHQTGSGQKNPKIPEWIRRTSFICPIYSNSRVILSWFTGQEALELESMTEEEIINGFSTTISHFLPSNSKSQNQLKFGKVLRTQWGTNPLFLGSYSYITVGSTVDDMDTLAEPLPENNNIDSLPPPPPPPPLQILFAGEATHRTHYSTTHGAYFSGLREANRLLKHYN
ncbi:hypothetical protein ACJIZ3_021309 [Penstemon smallii]|uniref:Amine oxidase domain-containing protein n=1 Tax=Penstemon smallii TaxID=265156 RepID=A0ABD3SLQ0_9LAMI